MVIQTKKWGNDMLEGYLKLISVHIFNRKPAISKKALKGIQKLVPETNAPLGLQIHFTDIFMEELAKVGGGDEEEGEGTLKWAKILKILRVFMYELGHSGDDRLLEEIRERIFNQLMKQSDVGIDWQEEMMMGGEGDLEEIEGEEEVGEEEEEQEELEGGLEEEDDGEASGELDPRAGAVDVVLPQLQVDYGKLVEKLVEFGGQKEVKLKNRRILYGLASQFREITEGNYPLAVQADPELNKPAVTRKEVKRKVKELMEEEEARLGGVTGKGRKSKKQRRKEIKRLRMLEEMPVSAEMNESQGSEDNSKYIQDEELLEHVADNYMSYLEEGMESKEEEDGGDQVDSIVEEAEETPSKKGKKTKKRKWKTEVEVEEEPEPEKVLEAPEQAPGEESQVIVVKRPRKRLSLGSGSPKVPTPTTPVLKGKARRLTEIVRTPLGGGGPALTSTPGSASKRVSFVLNRNLEHGKL